MLLNIALIELGFTGISHIKDKNGKFVAILQLADPISLVRGSQEFMVDGVMRPVVAHDVIEVKVHEDDFIDGLEWDDETNTGSYKGSDLSLDVSQAGQVWLKSKSFAAGSREFSTNARAERLRKAVGASPIAKTPENKENILKPVE